MTDRYNDRRFETASILCDAITNHDDVALLSMLQVADESQVMTMMMVIMTMMIVIMMMMLIMGSR